jgi:hypothetical protein
MSFLGFSLAHPGIPRALVKEGQTGMDGFMTQTVENAHLDVIWLTIPCIESLACALTPGPRGLKNARLPVRRV